VWALLAAAFAAQALLVALDDYMFESWLAVMLHLQASILFMVRRSATVASRAPSELAVATLGTLYPLAYQSDEGTQGAGFVVSICGILLALFAIAHLGRSFGIVPALRELRTCGPYAVVRHPIYAAYMLLDIGVVLSAPTPQNALIALAGIGLTALRIRFEERLLTRHAVYDAYARRVRYRLLPGLL
jgi:protein-S-isoprenylcysteine O-methyltransferase Ste14